MKLADSKLKTKRLLQNLDIPHPLLLDVIKNRKQLKNYDFSKFIGKDFVVKPNKGSKGKGIFICNMLNKNQVKASGKVYDIYEFKKQITDIIDGKYSLTLGNDLVLVEEKIIPGEDFEIFCEFGLSDIRLITMNLVPVMAMLRYPTKDSGGTANMAQGGLAFGIDIGSGKINSIFYNGKIYKGSLPEKFKDFEKKTIPYWDDMLLFSSQIQYFTNIGYLGLDWVVTDKGANLLEMNARAGMSIQLVNGVGLESRLKKISDLKIESPSKGVEIGKTLFSKKQNNLNIQKDFIYLEQPGILKYDDTRKNIVVKADLENAFNLASEKIIPDFTKFYTIKIGDLVLDNIKFKKNNEMGNIVSLGTIELENFVLVPKKRDIKDFFIWNPDKIKDGEENILEEIDNDIDKLSKKLNISKLVKSKNYMDELESFITWNGNYNPKFEYKYPNGKALEQIDTSLNNLKEKYFDIKSECKSGLFSLFENKIIELEYKLKLILAYKKQDFKTIGYYNKLLYGELDKELLEISGKKVKPFIKNNLGRKLSINEVYKKVKAHLNIKGLNNIKIIVQNNLPSRILVKRGDPITVNISRYDDIYEKEINMILAHEIDAHVVRYINGKKTGWNILQSGTGFYLKDEEGLAIRNSFRYLPKNYEKTGMYENYFLISQAEKSDFVHLANMIKGIHPDDGLLKIFKRAFRLKRGIQNTAFKGEGTAYYKDKIYLDGYSKVNKWIESGGNPNDLLNGKYSIDDLEYINLEILSNK